MIYCRFKVPITEETSAPGAVQSERDAWVEAIDKLCSDWKRKSMGGDMLIQTKIQRNLSITEETEGNDTDFESNGGFSGGNMTVIYPPADYANTDPTSGGGDHLSAGDMSQSPPSADYAKPIPKPCKSGKTAVRVTGPDVVPLIPSPKSSGVAALSSPTCPPPLPSQIAPTFPSTVPEPPSHESGLSVMTGPSPPSAPLPPPLPFKSMANSKKACTKAFHWDLVSSDKVTFSIMFHQKTLKMLSHS